MKYLKIFIIFIISITFLSSAHANKQVTLKADQSLRTVAKGKQFEIKITMQFHDDWYTYGMTELIGPEGLGPIPTSITLEPSDLVEIKGKIKEPKPGKKFDKAFEMDVLYHKGIATFYIPAIAKKDLNFPNSKLEVVVDMQICNSELCMPPDFYKALVSGNAYASKEEEQTAEPIDMSNLAASDDIIAENVTDESTTKQPQQSEDKRSDMKKKKDEGIFSFLWFSMTAGALALLTPCVFPMVPITVSFFTRRAEKTKGKGLRDALVYAFGIIFTFTALGFIFSLLFGASGIQDFTANPIVNFVIALIFILFAFNLFGAFEIQIPSSITNKLNSKSMEGEGITSVILMGLTFSLASFSCTGPLVAAALVSAATGDWFYPIISMLGFSTVLAAPFFLLALFPSALTSLPRAGGWMNNIKVVLGFVVIAATMKFLNNAFYDWGFGLSREIFLSIWIACTSLATIYILGGFKMAHDTPLEKVGSMRIVFAILFTTFTFYLMSGFTGKPMGTLEAFLPAPELAVASAGAVTDTAADVWYDNIEDAKKAALSENKPIFLDFTGKHCPNCRLMERNMFPQPEVAQRLNQMIKVKLITDLRQEPYITNKQYQLDNFNTVAIPFYVVMTPNAEVIETIAYTTNKDEFIGFLDKSLK